MFKMSDMKMAVHDASTLKKYGLINKYSLLEYTQSYSGVGNFNLNCALIAENSELLKRGRVIVFEDDIAGIIEYIERDATKSGILYIKGPMIEGMLNYRIVYPKFEEYDYPENIICKLVEKYCATGAKKYNLLEIEYPKEIWSESKITYQKTGGLVADALQTLSETYGIGYRISVKITDDIKTGERTRKYIFKLYKGTKRTLGNGVNKTALFGFGFNNILTSDYVYNAQPYRNFAVVAGEGEGEERKIVEVYDPIATPHNFTVHNMIENDSFEDGIAGYNLTDLDIFDIVEEYQFRGKKCLRMYGKIGTAYVSGAEYVQSISSRSLIPGHKYYCTFAVRFLRAVTAPEGEETDKLKNPVPIAKLGQETAYIDLHDNFTVGVVKIIRIGVYTAVSGDEQEGLKIGFPLVDGYQINTELVIDSLVLVDLSEAFGNSEIPDSDWCKANIPIDMSYGANVGVVTYTYEMPTDFNLREVYVDARDIQSLDEPLPDMPIAAALTGREIVDQEYIEMLMQRGREKLTEDYRAIESYKAEIRNDEKAAYIYGRDFYLGDTVTVIDDELSLRLDATVTSVTVSAFEGGRSIEPVFGFELPTVYQQIKKGVI